MSSQTLTRIAAVLGVLAGLAAVGGGLYAHFKDPQPIFGIPGFMWVDVPWLSGVHQLVGLGLVMVAVTCSQPSRPRTRVESLYSLPQPRHRDCADSRSIERGRRRVRQSTAEPL
jgi:hypothetical protein